MFNEEIDVKKLIQDSMKIFESQAKFKGIKIINELNDIPKTFNTDKKRVK